MQPITSSSPKDPTCSAQYIACIEKQTRLMLAFYSNYMHRGLSCSKEKLESTTLHEVVPPNSATAAFFSCGKLLKTMGLHVMTCVFYLIKQFDSRIKLNLINSNSTVLFDIFLG
jgi:hypothetical protein